MENDSDLKIKIELVRSLKDSYIPMSANCSSVTILKEDNDVEGSGHTLSSKKSSDSQPKLKAADIKVCLKILLFVWLFFIFSSLFTICSQHTVSLLASCLHLRLQKQRISVKDFQLNHWNQRSIFELLVLSQSRDRSSPIYLQVVRERTSWSIFGHHYWLPGDDIALCFLLRTKNFEFTAIFQKILIPKNFIYLSEKYSVSRQSRYFWKKLWKLIHWIKTLNFFQDSFHGLF